MLLLKLAFLNIGRNPRRSLITIAAVAVGLAALIFLWGFSDGTSEAQRENVIRLLTGHVQIHAQGFEKTVAPELVVPEMEKILEAVLRQAQTTAVSERVKSEALVGTSENSRAVMLIGIDPQAEPKVTELHRNLKAGTFLEPGADREVLVGTRLAERIGVAVGDKAVVLTQAIDGTMAGFAYRVRGIFETGSEEVDEHTAFIALSSGRELLGLEDQSHEIVIRLQGRSAIPSFLTALREAVPAQGYETLTWDQIVPEVEQWVIWSESIIRTILVTVMIVIGVGIMNTVLMSIFERTRELGVMMAIGTRPPQIVALILLETFVLEFFGILLGLGAGFLVVFYFSKVGIRFTGVEEAFASTFMSTTVYTRVEPVHVLQSVVTLFLLTGFVGLYPAWKAGSTDPVKAIYHSY